MVDTKLDYRRVMRKVLHCGNVMNIVVFNQEMVGNVTRFGEFVMIFSVLATNYCGILTKNRCMVCSFSK